MRESFNLIDRKWIPVQMLDGSAELKSIQEVFSQASTIRSIEGDNPFQVASITRLVLAVMYRSLTPLYLAQKSSVKNADVELWRMLWEDRTNRLEVIVQEYLGEYHKRFDLLDPKRPFFQVANLEYREDAEHKRSLGRIMPDSDRIAVFRNSAFDIAVDYAEAARILVTYQSWSTTAPLSPVEGMFPDEETTTARVYQGGMKGWCSSIGVTIINGANLYETLMLNFIPTLLSATDVPFWEERNARKVPVMFEKDEESGRVVRKKREAKVAGQVQLFVWFAKSVRLIVENGMVVGAVASEFNSLGRSSTVHKARHFESQTAWRSLDKGEIAAFHPVDMSAWRNIPPLLPKTREGFMAPANIIWAAKVTNMSKLTLPVRIRTIGAKTDDKGQTFRGVLDSSFPLNSISSTASTEVSAAVNDAAAALDRLVGLSYRSFLYAVMDAKGETSSSEKVDAQTVTARSLLNKEFIALFRNISAPNADIQQCVATTMNNVASWLRRESLEIVSKLPSKALIGDWTVKGSKKVFVSAAAAQLRLVHATKNYVPAPIETTSEIPNMVRAVISATAGGSNVHRKAFGKTSISSDTVDTFIANSVIGHWENNKLTPSGKSAHVSGESFVKKIHNMSVTSGVIDRRVLDVMDAKTQKEASTHLGSLLSVMRQQDIGVDYGIVAETVSSIFDNPYGRVIWAQDLVRQNVYSV